MIQLFFKILKTIAEKSNTDNSVFLLSGVEVYILKIFASCSFRYIYKDQLS